MAINITGTSRGFKSNEILYKVLEEQTPLDFAVSYLSNIESLFQFFVDNNITNYEDFYNTDKYVINNYTNPMKLNRVQAATKPHFDGCSFDDSFDISFDICGDTLLDSYSYNTSFNTSFLS